MGSWLTGSAIKSTKELLAQEPENISLWAGYARLERKRGKIQSARAVYAAILANHTQVSTSKESPALAMWADWAKMEWADGDQDRCIELLVSFADSRVPGGYYTNGEAAYGAGRLLDKSYEPQKVSSLAKLKARQVSRIRLLLC
jgi:predicted Zn-dependent protease